MSESFTYRVKNEIYNNLSKNCSIYNILGIIYMCGEFKDDEIIIKSDSYSFIIKCFTLIKKTFNISNDIFIKKKSEIYQYNSICITGDFAKDLNKKTESLDYTDFMSNVSYIRNFLKGVFLSNGYINNPGKSYHLEIKTFYKAKADFLIKLFFVVDIEAKVIIRKNYYVIYIKDSESIMDVLVSMGANNAFMEFENIRIIKDVRNNTNRQVNCETANIKKTVSASIKQRLDIEYIRDNYGLEKLPKNLREIAFLRLEMQNANLKELGESLVPAISKSGVNHRLRKLSYIANKLKNNEKVSEEML